MAFVKHLKEALRPAVDLIYPPRCPICGAAIAEQNGLCSDCWSDLVIPGKPACKTCQRPFGAGVIVQDGAQCAPCMAKPPRHDGIAAGTLYNDASRRLILSFKHGKRIALADMLSKLMVARLPELEGEWLFIPVPLHRTRLWTRGFNQSALLARNISKMTEQPLLVDGLIRTKRTKALGGLGKRARERMLQGSMVVSRSRKAAISGANIVLVDDVFTSGATSDACVRALKQGGANKVLICCFARVLDEALSIRQLESETPEV